MSIETLKNQLPEYAKDIKLNLTTLASDDTLTPQQLWGTWVASAMATGQAHVIAAVMNEAQTRLSPEAMQAAKAAASIMAMNNVYYRFVHLATNTTYQTMQAKLRMNVIGAPGVEKTDFELWSLAVSAINGCGMCIDSHEQHLLKAGMTPEQVQTAVRIAAVVNAAAATLAAETALNAGAGLAQAA
jgi:alkyl hydroperoxide reductase subunit D